MARKRVAEMKGRWVVLAAWLFIGAAASPAVGQSCCRCDFNGNPSSCNTGISDHASCEEVCGLLQSTFGQFETCPPGTALERCSGPDGDTFCDAVCGPAAPVAAPPG